MGSAVPVVICFYFFNVLFIPIGVGTFALENWSGFVNNMYQIWKI